MLVGIYMGQFCITTLTWFFISWFPLYLKPGAPYVHRQGRYRCCVACALWVGWRNPWWHYVGWVCFVPGCSLTFARKAPIIAGMALAMFMMLCNVVDKQWQILLLMSLAFFGKGFGALGWTVISDTSPRGMVGLNGGVFNFCGNIAGITTPLVIGYLVQRTGSYRLALIYVGVTALMAIASFTFIVGPIRRLTPEEVGTTPAII